MRVLYTGADGYIGAVLGPKLLARSFDAVGTVDDSAMPSVFHGRARNAAVEAMTSSGMDKYDIPAFLRKQAD